MTSTTLMWKQRGRFYMWRYVDMKHYPGWNLALNNEASSSLFTVLSSLKHSKSDVTATIKFDKPPLNVLAITGSRSNDIEVIKKMRLHFLPYEQEDHFSINRVGDSMDLGIGRVNLVI